MQEQKVVEHKLCEICLSVVFSYERLCSTCSGGLRRVQFARLRIGLPAFSVNSIDVEDLSVLTASGKFPNGRGDNRTRLLKG